MKKETSSALSAILPGLPLALLLILLSGTEYRAGALGVLIFGIPLALWPRGRQSPGSLTLGIWVVVMGLLGISALSGRFFLKEYCKLLEAMVFYMAARRLGKERTLPLVAWTAGFLALISLELGSTGLLTGLIQGLTGGESLNLGFEKGVRLVGALGNANVLAFVLALGGYAAMETLRGGRLWLGAMPLGACGAGFAACCSLGACGCFALSLAVYILLTPKQQRAALALSLLSVIIVGAVLGSLAVSFSGLALVFGLGAMAVSPLLQRALQNARLPKPVYIAVPALAAAYLILALFLTGGHSYRQSGSISRCIYPEPGTHTLSADYDGVLGITVSSQTEAQLLTGGSDTLIRVWYSGGEINFTVPEDTVMVTLKLWGRAGSRLNALETDGKAVTLDHRLVPEFLEGRLQGLFTSGNMAQRLMFWRDGLRLFAKSPVTGHGLGAFETAQLSVQSCTYETKYVHNHYIQLLIDGGIIGLLGWLCFLALTAMELKKAPAALGALSMIVLHSGVEVCLSSGAGLIAALALLGAFEEPKAFEKVYHKALYALPLGVMSVIIILNLSAAEMADPEADYQKFMAGLEKAAKTDIIDRESYEMSYAVYSLDAETEYISQKGAEYAKKLITSPSKTINSYILDYFLQTGDSASALEAALFGLEYSSSDSGVWNDYLSRLSSVMTQEYKQRILRLLDETNKRLIEPIIIEEENQYIYDSP